MRSCVLIHVTMHTQCADSEENEASDCMHILKALTSNAEQWKQVRTSESVRRGGDKYYG